MTITIRSRFDALHNRRDVLIVNTREGGAQHFSAPLQFQPLDPAAMVEPTIGAGEISGDEFLQAALNHAWEIGLRPVGFADTPKEIAALRDHLADLRALVFKDQVKPKGAA